MLLTKAENETAYLSAAIYGFAGSGKSFTAACIAIGLHKYIESKKPIVVIDTEAGTDFLLPHFKHNSIEVLRSKSRAFCDVLPTIEEAKRAAAEIIIVDSCSHLWKELCNAYEIKYKRQNGLQFQDWKNVKGEWGTFMTAVLNEPIHMILLGRAGYAYDYIDIDGKKTLVKTKTKMRAEGETEHEPSITLEMEQVTLTDDEIKSMARKQKAGVSARVTGQFADYMMYVLKDRANMLTGSVFKYPPIPGKMIEPDNKPFTDILPFIRAINIGGKHKGVDLSHSSEVMFAGHDGSYTEKKRRKDIVLANIKVEFESHFGRGQEDKLRAKKLSERIFKVSSWPALEKLQIDLLEDGYNMMYAELNPQKEIERKPASNEILDKIQALGKRDASGDEIEGILEELKYDCKSDPAGINPWLEKGEFRKVCAHLLIWKMGE